MPFPFLSLSAASAIFYIFSALISVFMLPESVPSILERSRMVETLRQQNLPAEVFEARKKQLLHQFSLQRFAFRLRSPLEQGLSQATASSKQSKRLHFNYVMVGRLRFCPCR